MPDMQYNLLTEPLLGILLNTGERSNATLPQVFTLLERDAIAAFTALQPHQKHAWHAFLVQLAAISLHTANRSLPIENADDWAAMFRTLTGGRDEAWCLIVPDLSQPAFFQPPVPEGTLDKFNAHAALPDELDILVTSKNHDIKTSRCRSPRPEHWLFALLTLQTMQGFLGAGNYGIARMNGGFSNRPCITLTPNLAFGCRFIRDINILLAQRETIVADRYLTTTGKALLWLYPWSGDNSFAPAECDPFFIEVCRRVRLKKHHGVISGAMKATKTVRVEAKELAGNTGDPWTPIDREGKALTIPKTGFNYRRTQELLFQKDVIPGITQKIFPQDPAEMLFLAWALVRGQGKTEGLHQRYLQVPARVRRTLASSDGQASLGRQAQNRVDIVANIQKSILKPALCALLQGGKEKLDFKDDRPKRWLDQLDEEVDRIFFNRLWEDLEFDAGEADRRWQSFVLQLAREQLYLAMKSAPVSVVRRYRAIYAAERLFYGCAKKHFPEINLAQENRHD